MLKFLFLTVFAAGISASRFDEDSFADTIFTSSERIIGGDQARAAQFPYQALLRNKETDFCGGSIIGARFILTAAQCTQGPLSDPSNIKAIVGFPGIFGFTRYELNRIINHPKFKQRKLENDISVLRTTRVIVFTPRVQQIALPTTDVPPEGNVLATVSGWGQYRHDHAKIPDNYPSILQWENTVTLNRTECLRRLRSHRKMFHKNTICTLNQPNVGVCLGDAGGPLTTRASPRVLIGVVSWSTDTCARGLPDIYARVFPHLEFIRSAM